MSVVTFINAGNSWIDAYVTVPVEYDQWRIVRLVASWGTRTPNSNETFRIEEYNQGVPVPSPTGNSITYGHTANTRTVIVTPTPMQLTAGNTIHVNLPAGLPGADAEGYTVTLYITP